VYQALFVAFLPKEKSKKAFICNIMNLLGWFFMFLDKKEQVKEKREKNRFILGLFYGTVLGILGNIWASFFIKVIEESPEVDWVWGLGAISIFLVAYGIYLAVFEFKSI
jgi:uncharacterized membrane protein